MDIRPALTEAGIDLPALADEDLMRQIQNAADDSTADDRFSELFRRYEARVQAWCVRFTGDRERSIDLSQEVFLKAYRHARRFRGDARVSTWLYAITHNHCVTSMKRRAAEPLELNDALCAAMADANALKPYRAIERNQSFRLMWELVSTTLNEVEVRVVTLHYGHDVPLAEITERLGLSNPSGAKAYIVSARRKLQTALRQRMLPAAA